jgi:hypothetical protein
MGTTVTSEENSAAFFAAIPGPHHCERCGETLDNAKAIWLELSTRTGRYAKAGSVPEADSQGCFSFGSACARAVLKDGGKNKKIRGAA